MKSTTFLAVILALAQVINANFPLTILHTNDVHARVEQTNKYGAKCSDKDAASGKCYGGVARRKTAIDKIRKEDKNVILLDGGDQFQGTLWFNVYKGNEARMFMNELNYTAMVREFSRSIIPLQLRQTFFHFTLSFLFKSNF